MKHAVSSRGFGLEPLLGGTQRRLGGGLGSAITDEAFDRVGHRVRRPFWHHFRNAVPVFRDAA